MKTFRNIHVFLSATKNQIQLQSPKGQSQNALELDGYAELQSIELYQLFIMRYPEFY